MLHVRLLVLKYVLPWFLLLTWILPQLVWLVRTVVKLVSFTDLYDWLLVVPLLQLWNVRNCIILGCYLRLSSTITISRDGHNCLLWGHFLSLWGSFFCVRLHRGVVSVLDLYFGECSFYSFSLLLSEWELVWLVSLVALKCTVNIYVFCGVLKLYVGVLANGTTGFAGRTLI